ncbi:MAG TPA: ERF family protein [Terriglobales bacterium]|nr:ERF family protein [Terriglobales bacterium]
MNSSENISTLAAALVNAQKAFAPAIKTAVNPHFKSKYVDLASAIEAAQPALLENGIAVIQGTAGDITSQSVTVTTRLLHSSGEWLEDSLTLPATNRGDFSAQSSGSAITYARRYSYMAILGFAPEDDDGNGASGKGAVQDTQRASVNRQLRDSLNQEAEDPNDFDVHMDQSAEKQYPTPRVRPDGPRISEAQANRFFAIAMGSGKTKQEVNNYLGSNGYERSTEIIKSEYEKHCEWAAAK